MGRSSCTQEPDIPTCCEVHLRGLQALALYPANSMFVEGYLVTKGTPTDQVSQLIKDAGFELAEQIC